MLAAIRPTDWNWILFFHLVTAFLLVGGLIVVLMSSLAVGRTRPELVPLLRLVAFRTTLILVIPMYVLIHVFGPMLADREYPHDEPGWLGTSFALATLGSVVALILVALQFWSLRRVRARRAPGWPEWLATWLPALLLASLAATIVLMAGKPS